MTRPYREFVAKAGKALVRYGYSTRKAGYPDFYKVLEKRGPMTVPEQTHSANVHRTPSRREALASNASRRDGVRFVKNCDALVTDRSGRILTVRTADCLPIFIWDQRGGTVAVVHAGWKGTHRKIAVKTVARLKRLGVKPRDLRVVFGPAIRSCCYEVGPDFALKFPALTLGKGKGDHLQFDLVLANRLQLAAAGIPKNNFRDLKLCTACDTRTFFSYRREAEQAGRLIHWIYLKVI